MGRKLLALFAGLGLLASTLLPMAPTEAQAGDCSDNSIVRCGAFSTSQLKSKMGKDNVHKIFAHYGIKESHFGSFVNGTVHKNGEVKVDGKVVATKAVSTGRQNMPGSTHVKSVNVFERPTSVSFRSSSLPAFVKMEKGEFKYAIIKSCGNPVRAVPVKKEVEKPVKKEPVKKVPVKKVVKKPAVKIEKRVSQKQVKLDEQFSYTITVRNTGETALNGVEVVDEAPDGVSFVEAENTTTTEFRTTVNSMAVGASETFTVRASMGKKIKGHIKNVACVTAREIKKETCASAVHKMRFVKKVIKELPPREEPEPEPEPEPVKKVVKKKKVVREVERVERVERVEGKQVEEKVLPVTGPGLVFGAAGSISLASYFGSLAYNFLRRRLM